jgi:general secretion pathway protein J
VKRPAAGLSRARSAGFTLLELLIALAIVGALLAVAFGGLRVALAAWRQGEERAEVHQHARGVALTLGRAIAAAYPYRASKGLAPESVILFTGAEDRLEFVTQVAPFPFSVPIAFTAVVISLEEGEEAGLVIRQRALPNRDPFEEAAVAFRDRGVARLEFSYLDEDGNWQSDWDGENERAIPRAVRVAIGTNNSGGQALPPLTISLRTTTP